MYLRVFLSLWSIVLISVHTLDTFLDLFCNCVQGKGIGNRVIQKSWNILEELNVQRNNQ